VGIQSRGEKHVVFYKVNGGEEESWAGAGTLRKVWTPFKREVALLRKARGLREVGEQLVLNQ